MPYELFVYVCAPVHLIEVATGLCKKVMCVRGCECGVCTQCVLVIDFCISVNPCEHSGSVLGNALSRDFFSKINPSNFKKGKIFLKSFPIEREIMRQHDKRYIK